MFIPQTVLALRGSYFVSRDLICVVPEPVPDLTTSRVLTMEYVEGRKVTGFTNGEEEGVGLTDVVPFLLEDMLKGHGADYSKGEDWAPYVLVDGKLVTGQNPASSEEAARELLKLVDA